MSSTPTITLVPSDRLPFWSRITALASRELLAYFVSPIAYVVLAAILIVLPLFGTFSVVTRGESASLEVVFQVVSAVLVFALPLLTMRLISEEYRIGSIESLMTAPIHDGDVILGKFFGTLMFYLVILVTTLIYLVALAYTSRLDAGTIAAGYLGLVLLGALYIAVGIFFSACTRHQVVAGLLSMITLSVLTFMANMLSNSTSISWLREILQYAGVQGNFSGFSHGEVSGSAMVYFLTMTGFFLFCATKVLESKRWR